ncbi:M1-specific T cell receptor alpha chain-like isoform X1 [Gopherus evgoodei]|uniref:M1-specific T cell receptor alpha chain-like isoform X1 n=1 Tax=Gopherus evgoodei TaxID=1825980 RepID=UPI0011CFA292|nr:M1-specific T cell receptor alpha chain-like isoform X1 [Gopherus evgoodei]
MLFTKYLLLSFMVVRVQLFLHQLQPFLFVNINDTAKIQCSSKKQFVAGGITVQWYRRREGEAPMLIKRCSDHQNVNKVACISEGDNLTLAIYNAQRNDSGVYYCTDSDIIILTFGNGSTLIVGDSYTTSSWVLPLASSPHSLLSPGTADLACVVHGVSNAVQISWSISGDLQEQGLLRSLKAKDGSLVFINHISVPVATWTSGKNFTCDVKFNSSGKSVKKIASFLHSPCQRVLTLHCAPCGWSWPAAAGGVSEPHLDPLPFNTRIQAQDLSTSSFRGEPGWNLIRSSGFRFAESQWAHDAATGQRETSKTLTCLVQGNPHVVLC